MSGCWPSACLVKVCLNAGKTPGGKCRIQDRLRFDRNRLSFILSEIPSNPCLS